MAQVSLGTASRVLNDTRTPNNVGAETAERVRAVAARLGYRVDAAARSLRDRRTGAVLYLQDGAIRPLGRWECLQRITETIERQGLHLVFGQLPAVRIDPDTLPKTLRHTLADGCIVNTSDALSPDVERYIQSLGIPRVTVNDQRRTDSVYPDEVAAARALTLRLVARGHRRIAFVEPDEAGENALHSRYFRRNDRRRGFIAALQESGLPAETYSVTDYHEAQARAQALEALISRRGGPTALVIAEEPLLVLRTLRRDLGSDVPGDVSVVGCGLDAGERDAGIAGYAVDWTALGRQAAALLLQKMEGPDRPIESVAIPMPPIDGDTLAAV